MEIAENITLSQTFLKPQRTTMRDTYWIIENHLAGSTGPNLTHWDYPQIHGEGFRTILSVNNGEEVDGRKLAGMNINHAVIPMTHRAPPEDGDLERCLLNLPLAVQYIGQNSETSPVLLHCRSGKDRTGLVAAAYLMTVQNLSASEAIEKFRSIRPIAFSAPNWDKFSISVLNAFEKQSRNTKD